MGGAKASLGAIFALAPVDGNVTWLKGTATLAATISANISMAIYGYGATRGDGTHATITTATNSVPLFTITSDVGYRRFRHLTLTNTAGTRAVVIALSGSAVDCNYVIVEECVLTGFSSFCSGSSGNHRIGLRFTRSEVGSFTGDGINQPGNQPASVLIQYCYVHDCGGDGIKIPAQSGVCAFVIHGCVVVNNAGDGLDLTANSTGGANCAVPLISHCVFAGNTGDGIKWTSSTSNQAWGPLNVNNTIFWDNGGYGINQTGAAQQMVPPVAFGNAYGSNNGGGSGLDRLNFPAGEGDVTLSADPFTNAAGGDYTLNATAGGGADLVDAGVPATVP